MPLALIGGLGLAGQDSLFPKWKGIARKSCATGATVILWIIVIINAFSFYSFRPSPCCNLVTSDDLAAIEWIKTNVPPDRSIFVPGRRTIYQFLDVDAAMWITPLTGRDTIKREYNTDLTAPETLGEMCRRGVTHVYASSMPLSFRLEALEAVPSWYKPVLMLPKAQIYEVAGCR